MADISTNPQASPSSSQQQSFPSIYHSLATVNVANFVTIKLSGDRKSNNYACWKLQMESLMQSHDLLRFIDGSIKLDREPTAADDAVSYDNWRTDKVLRGWILGTILEEKLLVTVAKLETSRKVWSELEFKSTEIATAVAQPRGPRPTFFKEQIPLLKAALKNNWDKAEDILQNLKAVDRSVGAYYILSPFQAAVTTAEKAIDFARELIDFYPRDLWVSLKDDEGHTALHIAASVGNIEAARLLIQKAPDLCNIPSNYNHLPIHSAAQYSQRVMLDYLISETVWDPETQHPYAGEQGLQLLLYTIDAEFFDIAWMLVERFPDLALFRDRNEVSALVHTVGSRVFTKRERINFWGRRLPRIKNIKEESETYKQALILVDSLCKIMQHLGYYKVLMEIYEEAILKAAELGVPDVFKIIADISIAPFYTNRTDSKQLIFHKAAENREECVFHLINEGRYHRHLISNWVDENGNNILHLAAKLAPSHKLNKISGAALQMQREIQWFKEVKDLVLSCERGVKNLDGKTPTVIFMEEHKILKEEGEKWIKHTANSYTISAALIATVMFAAAITVPGGNEDKTGHPMFSKDDVFILFAISDAISLFTSVASLLLFLAILTSRYDIKDFKKTLPQRMIFGLATLFLSITFMMISFGATLHLMFGQKRKWVLILVFILVCFPVLAFMRLQCSLLFDLISSTYFPIRLGKESNRRFY